MTVSMIITLLVVVAMVVVIILDKLPFGAPALIAAALLVLLGQADVATAFSGFTNTNVIMVMGFMACTVAFQKTALIGKVQGILKKVAERGGIAGFALLIFAIMALANIDGGTSFFLLVINIIVTIPYSKKLPTSRLVLPAGLAVGSSGWLPKDAAMTMGLVASLCTSSGFTGDTSLPVVYFCLINITWSAIYLVWSLIGHKLLPDRDISETLAVEAQSVEVRKKESAATLTKTQETIVYLGYAFLIVVMMVMSKLPGEVGYIMPIIVASIFMICGVYSFQEMLKSLFSPVIIMMASVIGVAAAMNNCGLSDYIGSLIANLLGANPSMFVLILVFGFLTSIMSTFTGASFGSLFIFAPIGITLCMQYGYSPLPLAYVCIRSAFYTYFMPIDGVPAMTMGMGKYKLTEFWKFTIPMWVLQMFTTAGLAYIFFA